MSARTCRLVTLGCKVNQYETQLVKESLEASGWREASAEEPAELCVVNTCTVTMEGDAKSRQTIRRLHQEQPGASIVVMGCYATRAPDEVKRLPGVERVVVDKARLAEELGDYGVRELAGRIRRFDGHQRAFVKVQDGCLLNCSFCIIPKVRPVLRSRDPRTIVLEIAGLVERGCQEIVLTGIHLGHYGIDLCKGKPKSDWRRLWHLLEMIQDLPGPFRVRLSSLEAAEARDDLVRAMRDLPRIVPHLHLCLQSGSDRILALMKRRYSRQGYLERVARISEALDHPAITTDVIVGFPGETEADFEATCDLARRVGFAKMHLFSYSSRTGTEAVHLPDRVSPQVQQRRRRQLGELDLQLTAEYAASLVGRRLEVLVEGVDPVRPGQVIGTSCRHLPVSFAGRIEALKARLVDVSITGTNAGTLVGRARQELPLAD